MKRRLSGLLIALSLVFGAVAPTAVVLAPPAPIELAVSAPVMLATATLDAPDPAPELPNPAVWFLSTTALAAIVASLVAFLKKHFIKSLDGLGTVIASLIVGVLMGVVGHLLGYLTDGLVAAIGFGGSAGLLASGGWDALKGILGKRSAGA